MGKFLKKNWAWLLLLSAVVVGGIFWFNRSRNAAAQNTFQTAVIERGKLTATIGATGTVRARQSAILVWQTAGTVDTVNVKVGDNVPAGFVMAYLSKSSLPQSIILAEADLVSAQKTLDDLLNSDTARAQAAIALRDAQAAYDRARKKREGLNGLIDIQEIVTKTKNTPFGKIEVREVKTYKGYADATTIAKADEELALAKAKLDDAQRTYDRLISGNVVEITAAQARIDAAKATLNLARVIAPFNGIVTEAYPLPGDLVNAGMAAFRLDDLSSLLVDVSVSEVDINSVEVGQPVKLTFDAILGREYNGVVVEVAKTGTVTAGVVSFKVTVELTDADALVKPGMTAAVNITVKELDDVLLVPNRAVRLSEGERVVYVLENGQPVKKIIRLGLSSDTMSVLAGGELQESDLVILNPPTEFFGPRGGGPFGN
ncbi:MAG: efflux RND transporter periplasmic adaptor subunit [Chloroflexota bacterium]|nr:efflux RND transporter periplasmic adaptor subunit [Chloroflexota bacterium]MBI5703488.1 efflux RND transporter periplasmic adaptor subunit [Chloroflexota bacterium]